MIQIGLKKFLLFKKFKTLFCGHMLLVILKAKKLLEGFTQKNCRKQMKKILELNEYLREKKINYMLNEKDTIIHLIAGQIKKTQYK